MLVKSQKPIQYIVLLLHKSTKYWIYGDCSILLSSSCEQKLSLHFDSDRMQFVIWYIITMLVQYVVFEYTNFTIYWLWQRNQLAQRVKLSIDIKIEFLNNSKRKVYFSSGLTLKSDMLVNLVIGRWQITLKLTIKRGHVAQWCYCPLFEFMEDCMKFAIEDARRRVLN